MLVVHIGPRKTATTYLQRNFHNSREELLSKGWLYPALSVDALNAHHEIASSLKALKSGKGALVRSMARAGRQAADSGANILISSERFQKWNASDFAILGERFGQREIVIVYMLRDPIDLLVSNWGETVKNGHTPALKIYANRHLRAPMKSSILNCLNRLQPVIVEPGLKLIVLDLEGIKKNKLDLYTVFGNVVLGLNDLEQAKINVANKSYPSEINDYLRLLSREMKFDAMNKTRSLSRQFLRCHPRAQIDAIAKAIRATDLGKPLTFRRDKPWYGEVQAEILSVLGDRLQPSPQSQKLFGDASITVVAYDIDKLMKNKKVADHLAKSLTRMASVKTLPKYGRAARAWRQVKRWFSVLSPAPPR
jgi:hypothetical protein